MESRQGLLIHLARTGGATKLWLIDQLQQKPASSLTEVRAFGCFIQHSSGKGVPSKEEDIALNLDSPSSEDELFNISKTLYEGLGAVPAVTWALWHLRHLQFAFLQQWEKSSLYHQCVPVFSSNL